MVLPISAIAGLVTLIQLTIEVGERARIQKRNCALLTRRLEVLLPLLAEVVKLERPLTCAQVATFDALENAIKKCQQVLQKCCQAGLVYRVFRGAGLMQDFQDCTLELDRCLHCLPLVQLKVSDQIRDGVNEVSKQLRSTKYVVEEIDQKLSQGIAQMLAEQREGAKANEKLLKTLLSKLELQDGVSLKQETTALEVEKQEAHAEKLKQEEAYIEQIIALLHSAQNGRADEAGPSEVASAKEGPPVPPAEFLCPISLQVMADPVVVATGQTYERACIQQWLAEGNRTCPVTRQSLQHLELIPNYTLRGLIASWCEIHELPTPHPPKLEPLGFPSEKAQTGRKGHWKGWDPGQLDRSGPATAPSYDLKAPPGSFQVVESAPQVVVAAEQRNPVYSVAGEKKVNQQQVVEGRRAPPSELNLDRLRPGGARTQAGGSSGGMTAGDPNIRAQCREVMEVPLARGVELGGVIKPSHRRVASAPVEDPSRQTAAALNAAMVEAVVRRRSVDQKANEDTEDLSNFQFVAPPAPPPLEILVGSPMKAVGYWPSPLGSPRTPKTPTSPSGGGARTPTTPKTPPKSPLAGGGPPPFQLAEAPVKVDHLVDALWSRDIRAVREACGELRALSKSSMTNRALIASTGAIPPLIGLLDSRDDAVQEHAVTTLLNLSIYDQNKSAIAAAGAIQPLVQVLRSGCGVARENSAAALFSLSVTDDNKAAIGAAGAIPLLVDMLKTGSERGKKDAATALFNLSIFQGNKPRLVRAGAVPILVEMASDLNHGEKAVAVLANLSVIGEARVALGDGASIAVLVDILESGPPKAQENAAATLLQLALNSSRHTTAIVQEGAITPLIALSQTGTTRAREKATQLLKHFREHRHRRASSEPGFSLGTQTLQHRSST